MREANNELIWLSGFKQIVENFALPKEISPSWQKKGIKTFVLHSTFRNFGRNRRISLYKGNLGD
jgi:hypothetical protein